jgi:hypothetical protein
MTMLAVEQQTASTENPIRKISLARKSRTEAARSKTIGGQVQIESEEMKRELSTEI